MINNMSDLLFELFPLNQKKKNEMKIVFKCKMFKDNNKKI